MLQCLNLLRSPFLGFRPDELPASPHQAHSTEERNHLIAEAKRAGGTYREIGANFGISGGRVAQIVYRHMRKQARELGQPLGVVNAYYRPRKKEAEGDTYTAASSPAQWAALSTWKQAASDVADAQEEEIDWGSVRCELSHRRAVNEADRLRERERAHRNAIADTAYAEIVSIKSFYDSMDGAVKLIMKDELSAKIDEQLAILREHGRTYP